MALVDTSNFAPVAATGARGVVAPFGRRVRHPAAIRREGRIASPIPPEPSGDTISSGLSLAPAESDSGHILYSRGVISIASCAYLRAGWEYALRGPNGVCWVEFSAGIVPDYFSFPMPAEEIWEGRETVATSGGPVEAPEAGTLLLLLCVHGAKHAWERLEWMVDVAALVRARPDLELGSVLERAGRHGARRMVRLGLRLARDLLGTPLPEAVNRELDADRTLDALAARADPFLREGRTDGPSQKETYQFHLRARERWRDRVRYVFVLALAPSFSDWKLLPLPGPLFPLYYLIRPFRLALRRLRPRGATRPPAATPPA